MFTFFNCFKFHDAHETHAASWNSQLMKLVLPHEICQICSCIMGTVYSWNSNNVVGLVSLMKLVLHHGTRCPWDLALMEPCYIMKPVLHYETLVAQRDLLSMGHVSHYAATHETRVTHENSLPRVTSCSCPRVLVSSCYLWLILLICVQLFYGQPWIFHNRRCKLFKENFWFRFKESCLSVQNLRTSEKAVKKFIHRP